MDAGRELRVLMVHDYPPLTGGGLALAALEVGRMIRGPARVVVVSARARDHFSDDAEALRKPVRVDGCSVATVRLLGAVRVAALVTGADLVVIHWTFSYRPLSSLALLMAAVSRKRSVCVIHTGPSHTRFNWVASLPAGARDLLVVSVRRLLGRLDAVVALSAGHASALAAVGIQVSHVLPIPVRAPQILASAGERPRPRTRRLTVGVAGELSELKGMAALPGLMRVLTPSYRLAIVGRGPLRSRIDAELAALPICQRAAVVLRDPVPPADMPSFLSSVDCILVPSRTEAQGRLVVEAMLAGAVVLARPVEGLLDLVEDGRTGFFVEPERPDTVVRVLERLQDERLRAAISMRARRHASEYNLRAGTGWQGFLSEVCADAVPPLGGNGRHHGLVTDGVLAWRRG